MKLAGLLLSSALAFAQSKVTITGTFKTPDNLPVTGVLVVTPSQKSATSTCGGGTLQLGTVTIKITNGTLGLLQLYPSTCLSPPNGGSVTGVQILSPGSGYSGTCVASFDGPGMVMPAQAKCTFSGGSPNLFQMTTYGVYKVTTPPKLTVACNPACTGTVVPANTVVAFTKGQLYSVQVVLANGTILYSTSWSVPNGPSTIDVTALQ